MKGQIVKSELIEQIIKLEEEMFLAVRSMESAPCQQMIGTFRAMRNMSHSVLSEETLKSYFNDLVQAKEVGRNLMTEKYARMDNLIPPLSTNPLIVKIVDIEMEWMQQLQTKYPHAIKEKGGFDNYMRSELETYSDNTLQFYYRDIITAKADEVNFVEQRYKNLYLGLGFRSLDEVEETARKNSK